MLASGLVWLFTLSGLPLGIGFIAPILCLGFLETFIGQRAKRVPGAVLEVVAGVAAVWVVVSACWILGVEFWWAMPAALAMVGSVFLLARGESSSIASQAIGILLGYVFWLGV